MKKSHAALAGMTVLFSLVALAASEPWDATYTSYPMHYLMYSGELGDRKPPTKTEQRLSIAVQGRLAKDMFDLIGPDLKLACGTTLGMRQRKRGDVSCSFDRHQAKLPYTCHFGIDLRKGKSMEGATC